MTRTIFQALLEQAAGAPLPEWEGLAPSIAPRTLEPGGALFLQDAEHPYVYAVRDGLLKLCYLSEDGTEWVKSFAHEGRFFASIAALQPLGRTTFMVTAIEPSRLERIDFRLLLALAGRHLAWANALRTMAMVFGARKEQRERELLTLSAEQRYVAFCASHPGLVPRIPQKDLARHLGVTPVGLNRIVMRRRRMRPPEDPPISGAR